MKIAIIGYGNMGEAIYRMLASRFGASNLYAVDTHSAKGDHILTDPSTIIPQIDVIILAVKPQSFPAVTQTLGNLEGKRLLSILAGVSEASLLQHTHATEIVRAMPNLPLRVGKGLTAWFSSTVNDPKWVTYILDALGTHLRLEREELMDAVTAISGSGPAYFFFLCELLTSQAVVFGFPPEQARQLAEATFLGAAALLDSDVRSAEEWRKAVTSQGGTTAAALAHLQGARWDTVFGEALEKARARAKDLGATGMDTDRG